MTNYFRDSSELPKLNRADDLLTKQDVLDVAKNIENPRYQALFIVEYLTGSRISELVGENSIRKQDFERKMVRGKQFMYINNVKTLKKRKNSKEPKKRNIPIPIYKEKELLEILQVYLDTLKPSDVLFNMTRQRAYVIISEILATIKPRSSINRMLNGNHYFRHLRVSHLITLYRMSQSAVTKFMNWHKFVGTYEHLYAEDVAMEMVREDY